MVYISRPYMATIYVGRLVSELCTNHSPVLEQHCLRTPFQFDADIGTMDVRANEYDNLDNSSFVWTSKTL